MEHHVTRILVIGGGIAGTATALALHKAGFDVAVHEAHPDTAEDIGAFLTLASNGMRALAQLDASDAVTALGFPLRAMRVLDDQGAEMARVPLGEPDDASLRYRCVRRGELNAALQAEAVRRGIELSHGARLVSVQNGPSKVTARFADGGVATGDLLIGADGLNSAIRQSIAPGADPVYAGQSVFYGYTHSAPVAEDTGHITMVRGSGAAVGYAVSPDGETYWFARVTGPALPADELAHPTPSRWRQQLVDLLGKDATPAAGIVAASTDGIMATNATEIPPKTPWRSGRTLLIGDAAHAASPATGQGASMALEDAVILAKSLRDTPDPDSALTLYEAYRRPRVEHNITASGEISRGTRPAPSRTGRAPSPQRPGDDTLTRQLDWDLDMNAVGGNAG
ncbi:2-polyprenyl-6-methoxyphenol hydroxylase [Streptomyces sp. KS_16]|nr:2-polyprenyl-6-methoxyphenol hydroxylase-like FAD-dependent oxidoreductase [Streptomyces sp. 2321.6]SDR59468.1 2-polyprenyl-6-methoxyphenol hydroxylase [Streptomyces sp. KS_16]SEB68446.1 2-polyprenyl-6-methoxyphenol hydroxylase [Streptomyces sp. 2133.1]SNC59591.1 2-polyprenyl-6-methoxyphenol hydroxylase [Streptomyces sp. 2114.4]